jgi:hypothetical protein
MALETGDALRGFENDIGRVVMVFEDVARVASQRDGRMNVISSRMIGVTLQAVGILIESNGMGTSVAKAGTYQAGSDDAKYESRSEIHRVLP